jgi:hypothetical protein
MIAMMTAKLARIRWRKVQFLTVSPQEFNDGVGPCSRSGPTDGPNGVSIAQPSNVTWVIQNEVTAAIERRSFTLLHVLSAIATTT